ncbi:MAG: ABC transporter permease [Planctomycetes bacterium]|nr:ABC transporter permease [Planctomycetota bacterium]
MTSVQAAEKEAPRAAAPSARGPWRNVWLRLRKNRIAMAGAAILALLYIVSCFAGFLAPYDYKAGSPRTNLYGPMLLGGYEVLPVVERSTDESGAVRDTPQTLIITDPQSGAEREVPRLAHVWRWGAGIAFRNADGEFTLRPHVRALVDRLVYDEHGEAKWKLGVEREMLLPIEFFADGPEHEVFSLCGFFPIRGTKHLFGVRAPEGDPRFTTNHVAGIYLLGTDKSGRDLFSRILYGGQVSLSVGLIGILISMTIGLLVGGVSGYFGGYADYALMRFVELIMAIPGIYLILCLRGAFPADLDSRETYLLIVVVLALAGWASTGRVIRGMVLSIKEQEYAQAARALGATNSRVILRHILPNTASYVIVTATLYIPYYILGEVALSFLGLGITEPQSSWGLLLRDAQSTEILKYSPWLVLPGFFIFVAVLAYNFLGDGLRDAADPRAVLWRRLPT